MESHSDRDFGENNGPFEKIRHEFDMERLERRAKNMQWQGTSHITGGAPGESPLMEYKFKSINVRRMPNDEQDVLRISVGGGIDGFDGNYLVFRGDPARCERLLRMALKALERRPSSVESK